MDQAVQCALGMGVSTFFHPVTYSKTLIQIGYEPFAPSPSSTLFGSKVLMYPNIFKYIGHIKKTDGFLGLYRGLGARLVSGFVCSVVSTCVQSNLKDQSLGEESQSSDGNDSELADQPTVKDAALKLFTDTGIETLSRSVGIIVSHPFQVMFVRSVAQFVGRETRYTSISSSISEIWHNEGVLGFFVGLAPRLIGEVLTIWMANLLAHCLNTFIVNTQTTTVAKDLKGYTVLASQLVVTQLTYPFSVVSNAMCINNCGLAAGRLPFAPVYSDWLDCWARLTAEGQIKRGSSMFWRTYKGATVLGRDGTLTPVMTRAY